MTRSDMVKALKLCRFGHLLSGTALAYAQDGEVEALWRACGSPSPPKEEDETAKMMAELLELARMLG